MKTSIKLLLSIPYFMVLITIAIFLMNKDMFYKLNGNDSINIFFILRIFLLVVLLILLFDLWRIRGLNKKRKVLWTFILLMFGPLSAIYYIWKAEKELKG